MSALNILVVDDATFIRDLVKKAVRAQFPEFTVAEAADGRKAQAMMRIGKYDLILCDWEMPEMSGLELVQWMRSEEAYANIPFMMITSRGERSHVVKAVEAGVNDYIGKPFSNEQLGTKLARLVYKFYKLSPHQTARQAQQKNAADSASLLTGAAPAVKPAVAASSASLLTGVTATVKPPVSNAGSASLLTGAAPSAKLVDQPPLRAAPKVKPANRNLALANIRTPAGNVLRCIVKDINLNEMLVVVKRDEGIPALFEQVVVDIVSKEEDLVARVNAFVQMLQGTEKRQDSELVNMLVRYEDQDPEKLEALSRFVAKVR